jgi:hypothetical protein
MRRRLARLALPSAVVLIIAGCSGGGNRVTGKVLLDGNPLAGAEVRFEKGGKAGADKFVARTDEEGKFEIVPIGGRSIEPGKYVVLISKYVDKTGKQTAPEEVEQLRAAGTAKNIVPEKYNDPSSPNLTAEVKEGKTELAPFDLKTKGK